MRLKTVTSKYLYTSVKAPYTHYAINWAADNGHLDVVRYLFEIVHAPYTNNAMDCASRNGHLEVVAD